MTRWRNGNISELEKAILSVVKENIGTYLDRAKVTKLVQEKFPLTPSAPEVGRNLVNLFFDKALCCHTVPDGPITVKNGERFCARKDLYFMTLDVKDFLEKNGG
jgi:hypothetical protein